MLSLDQSFSANCPLVFCVTESDMEILQYIDRKYKDHKFFAYSTTMARAVPVSELMKTHFQSTKQKSQTTVEVLSDILNRDFSTSNNKFETYVFLNCNSYINDKQVIRRIKDIISRYQLDEGFTVSLLFVSQTVCVPIDLERISEVVFFDLPAPEELKELSDTLSKKLDLKDTFRPSPEVVNNLSGLTKFEVEQAYLQSYALFKKSEGNARIDLNFIRSFKKSAIAKTDLLSLLETDVTFNDIGGMDRLKRWITRSAGGWTIEGKKYGLPIMKGVLLVGPPGTGKSLIAKSIGNEWGLPVVKFDFSKIFSSRVGDSEANLRRVLKLIEGISPVIVFIDELEKSMAGVQSSTFSDSGVTARLIGVYLSWFQDCEKPIFTVGTSNNISYVPPEMISRFEEVFFVNMPQQAERGDIVGIHLKKVGRDPDKFDLPLIAERSKDFTGREIEQIIKESLYNSFHDGKEIDTEQILSVIDKKTSVIITMQEQMRALYKWVGWDDKRMDGIRARYASVPNDLDVSKIRSEIDAIINDLEQGKA